MKGVELIFFDMNCPSSKRIETFFDSTVLKISFSETEIHSIYGSCSYLEYQISIRSNAENEAFWRISSKNRDALMEKYLSLKQKISNAINEFGDPITIDLIKLGKEIEERKE